MAELGNSPDEEIVALVETDMCAVDALQSLVGCTFGKGNLAHRDYGKRAFSFYRRRDGKAARLVARPGALGETAGNLTRLQQKLQAEGLNPTEEELRREHRAAVSREILEKDLEELFDVQAPAEPVPERARISASLVCEVCGEEVMETRIRRAGGRSACIPCARTVAGGS